MQLSTKKGLPGVGSSYIIYSDVLAMGCAALRAASDIKD